MLSVLKEPRNIVAYLVQLAVVALSYCVLAKLGLIFGTVLGNVTLFWPPGGLALALLLLWGLRCWPGITLGYILATMHTGAPWIFIALTAVGGTLFPVAAAVVLKRCTNFNPALSQLRHAGLLLLVGGLGAPLLSAGIGAMSLLAAGMAAWSAVLRAGTTWWLGDGMGVLLVTPLILAWAAPERLTMDRRGMAAGSLIVLLALLLEFIVFGIFRPGLREYLSLAFLLVPLVAWAALRFGLRGATALTNLIAFIAVWSTARGYGPFAASPHDINIEFTWLFIAACAAMALFGGIVVEERWAHTVRQQRLVAELERALSEVRTLKGLLPICANCKQIRDADGRWQSFDRYISSHSEAKFTHGMCPKCAAMLYPDIDLGGDSASNDLRPRSRA
jgi:integral membrane sensor domain MASE1